MTAKKTAAEPDVRPGYRDPFILIPFPDLGDGCSVLIRNPKLLPPEKLQGLRAANESDDPAQQQAAMDAVMADLIVAWRHMYAQPAVDDAVADNFDDLEALMDELTGREQVPLGKPSAETVAQLPTPVITRISEEFKRITPDPK